MMPMHRILSSTLGMAVLFAMLLAGCDGDREAAEPRFDLTGSWTTGEPEDCENQEDLEDALLAAFLEHAEFGAGDAGDDLEDEDAEPLLPGVGGDAFHIDQVGNDLEVTYEGDDGTDVQVHGTLSGDQVHFIQEEAQDLQGLRLELVTEMSGTVLDDDRLELRQETEWSLHMPGAEPVMGTFHCTFDAMRN